MAEQGFTVTTAATPIISDERFQNPQDAKLKQLAKEEEAKADQQREIVREVNNATWLEMQQSPTYESTVDFETGDVTDVNVIEEDAGNISLGRKSKATASMFEDSFVGDIAGYFKHDSSLFVEENAEFKQNFTRDAVVDMLDQNGLGLDFAEKLSGAVSEEHAFSMIRGEKARLNRDSLVNRSLTANEKIGGAIATGLLSPDNFIAAPFAIAAKFGAAKNLMVAGAVTSELGLGAGAAAVNEELSMAEGLFYGSIGAFADTLVINALSKNYNIEMLKKQIGDDLPTDELINNLSKQDLKAEKFSEILDEAGKKSPNAERLKILEDEYADIAGRTGKQGDAAKTIEDLKSEIKARIETPKTTGFKYFNDRAVKLANAVKKTGKGADELRIAKQELSDHLLLSSEIGNVSKKVMDDLDAYIKADKSGFDKEMLDTLDTLRKQGTISDELYDLAKKNYDLGQGLPNIKMNVSKPKKDGTTEIDLGGKKYIVATAVALALASNASASEDGGFDVSTAQMLIVAGVLAALGIANRGKVLEVANDTKGAMKRAVVAGAKIRSTADLLDRTRDARSKLTEVVDKSRTSVTETLRPLQRGASKEFKNILAKIYYDPIVGSKNIDQQKRFIYDKYITTLSHDQKEYYREWLKATDTSKSHAFLTLFTNASKRSEFNRVVTKAVENGGKSNIPAVEAAARQVREMLDTVKDVDMVEAGIKGIDKAATVKNYLPRMVRGGNIEALFLSLDKKSKEAFINGFAKMFHKTKDPRATAEAYIDTLMGLRNVKKGKGGSSIETIKKTLKEKGIDPDLAEDVAEALGEGGSTFGRLKARIPMDKEAFEELTDLKTMDGSPIRVGIDDIIENDVMNVMQNYLSQASGHIAVGNIGRTTEELSSVDNLIADVRTFAHSPEVRDKVLDDISIILGRPLIDYSNKSNKFWRDASVLGAGVSMMMSTLSLTQELLTTTGRLARTGGISYTIKKMAEGVSATFGKDSMLMAEMKRHSPYGQHNFTASYGAYNTLDEVGSVVGGNQAGGMFGKSAEFIHDAVIHGLPFIKGSDMLQGANFADVAQLLGEMKSGKRVFQDYEKVTYGITPEFEKMLQKYDFSFNKQGYVKEIGLDNWSHKDRMDFFTVSDLMMNKRIQQPTFGTTTAFSRNSALGAIITKLLKFPMNAHANYGSFLGRGILKGDPHAMMQVALWGGGGMLTGALRAELKGKDYSDDDAIYDLIWNHPFMSLPATIKGMSSPMVFNKTGELVESIDMFTH